MIIADKETQTSSLKKKSSTRNKDFKVVNSILTILKVETKFSVPTRCKDLP